MSGERFLQRQQPGLEAQLANLADEIAYNNHDVDDGIRAGLITLEEVAQVPLVRRQFDEVMRLYPHLPGRRRVHETVRRMVNDLVIDVIESQRRAAARRGARRHRCGARAPAGADRHERRDARSAHVELKRFLHEHVYRHQRVLRMTIKARRVVQELFDAFMDEIRLMPAEYRDTATRAEARDGSGRARPHRGRLHRRHDRSLRDSRAPTSVRAGRAHLMRRQNCARMPRSSATEIACAARLLPPSV